MLIEKIKPIPKYILKRIRKAEQTNFLRHTGYTRFYSYLTKNDGELTLVTVACKNNLDSPRWRCKQVVVHGIHSDRCFLKDIVQHFMGNYSVGWYEEGLQKNRNGTIKEIGVGRTTSILTIQCCILNMEYL